MSNQQEGVKVPENKLLTEITTSLEAWQDEGKDYVMRHSFNGLAYEILAKIREVVEGAGLTPEEIFKAMYNRSEAPARPTEYYQKGMVDRLLEAQLQAILKTIKEDK